MSEETRIIEVNGIKLEVDLRNAKRIDQFRVGDPVKVLVKSYSDYKSHVGIIVGFDNFEKHPTIVIAYLSVEYSSASVNFVYYNTESKDVEIAPVNNYDIPHSKKSVLDMMDKEIYKKKEELRDLESKREYFINMFGKYFEDKVNF